MRSGHLVDQQLAQLCQRGAEHVGRRARVSCNGQPVLDQRVRRHDDLEASEGRGGRDRGGGGVGGGRQEVNTS